MTPANFFTVEYRDDRGLPETRSVTFSTWEQGDAFAQLDTAIQAARAQAEQLGEVRQDVDDSTGRILSALIGLAVCTALLVWQWNTVVALDKALNNVEPIEYTVRASETVERYDEVVLERADGTTQTLDRRLAGVVTLPRVVEECDSGDLTGLQMVATPCSTRLAAANEGVSEIPIRNWIVTNVPLALALGIIGFGAMAVGALVSLRRSKRLLSTR